MTRRAEIPPAATTLYQGRVCGLDLSSVCVGWAVFDNAKPRRHGKYRQEGKGHGEKLANFEKWLLAHLQQFRPVYLLIEMPYAGRRRYAFGVLMMYVAAAYKVYYEWCGQEIPAHAKMPAHMVKRLLGARKGRSYEQRKRDMVLLVNQLYGTKLRYKSKDPRKMKSDDDIADAYALVHAWLCRGGPVELDDE